MIEHPDKTKDRASIYLAGADGTLNAYAVIHKTNPRYQVKQLDEMAQKRDQGRLADYVSNVTKKCKK